MTNLAVYGLILDIAGVLFLGAALAAAAGSSLMKQAGTYWGYNLEVLRILARQKIDAWIGLPLLVLGFSLQALAVLDISVPPEFSMALIGVVFAGLVGCVFARYVVADWYFRKLIAKMDSEKNGKPTLPPSGMKIDE